MGFLISWLLQCILAGLGLATISCSDCSLPGCIVRNPLWGLFLWSFLNCLLLVLDTKTVTVNWKEVLWLNALTYCRDFIMHAGLIIHKKRCWEQAITSSRSMYMNPLQLWQELKIVFDISNIFHITTQKLFHLSIEKKEN